MAQGKKEDWKRETEALTEWEISEAIRLSDLQDEPGTYGVFAQSYRILRLVQDPAALKTIMELREKVKALSTEVK